MKSDAQRVSMWMVGSWGKGAASNGGSLKSSMPKNWAVSQEKLMYEDIAKHEEELAREEEIEAFKKLTDRIL